MGQKSINEFWKGCDKDTDVSKMDPTTFRGALNIRLINKDGQGFVGVNIGGNEKAFNLSPGFIPLGKCEYNGICYIFSFSPQTNEGEFGCYPSPNANCLGGFQHAYSPIMNFTGPVNPFVNPNAQRLPFRTTKFNFDCEHQIECFARIDYDDSVNIYFCDQQKNPFRVVNSGFTQQGVCTNRLYWDGSFPNGIDAFAETCNFINCTQNSIDSTGQLLAGNYIFFFRYTTLDFNPTSFLGESNANQISPDDAFSGITIQGAAGNSVTNKSVTLTLSNLDVSYPYIEVAFAYYHDGLLTTGLIDQLYNIQPNSTTLQITITGSETVIDFPIEDIIQRKPSDDVPKTITQLENRAWLGNLRSRNKFHPDLFAAAQAIKIGWDDSLTIDDRPFATGQNPLGVTAEGQYKDYRKTYNEVGYFRGETYPFCIVWVFTSGRESEPMPLTGFDAWLDPGFLTPNSEGIFRFPSNGQAVGGSPFRTDVSTGTGVGLINILGVTFDTSAVIVTQWMKDNICGFYFTRGERNENLYYQGITLRTFVGDATKEADCSNPSCGTPCLCLSPGSCPPTTYASPNRIPLWEKFGVADEVYAPFLLKCSAGTGPPTFNIKGWAHLPDMGLPVTPVANKYGVYSPDHHFLKTFADNSYFIVPQGDALMVKNYNNNVPDRDPSIKVTLHGLIFSPPVVGKACCYNIQEWNTAENNGFTSEYNEGSLSDPDSFWYTEVSCGLLCQITSQWYNRKFATGRYIGLDQDVSCVGAVASILDPVFVAGSTVQGTFKIVNIYRRDPVTGFTLTNEYDVKNVKYFKITDFIPLGSILGVTGTPFYKGDCFVQRVYIKQLYNPDFYITTQTDDAESYYTFGVVHGTVIESKINNAMRHQDSNNKYWPKTGLAAPGDFIYDDILFEADLQNRGYNQILSPSPAQFGMDINLPFRGDNFITRIRYTEKYIPGSFQDGYRKMLAASFQDYDYRLGAINKIIDLHARLVSVQDHGINYHYVNDRQALDSGIGGGGALLIGTGTILAEKSQNITDEVGTQHQWSVAKSDYALYGIDYNKRKIWRLISGGGVEIISDTRKYKQKIYEIAEQGNPQNLSDHTDIIHELSDNPVCNEGIVAEYDRKYREIVWSFIFNQTVKNPKNNSSFRFSEMNNAFLDEYSNITPFYFRINDDFFTANPAIFPSQNPNPTNLGDVWLEDVPVTTSGVNNRTTFWGTLYPFRISWIVNQNQDFTKVFDYLLLYCSPVDPSKIDYQTLEQSASQNPFRTGLPQDLYIDPNFREAHWRVPIRRADMVTLNVNNIYSVGSRMRGNWLKISLEYLTAESIFAKSAVTEYRFSPS